MARLGDMVSDVPCIFTGLIIPSYNDQSARLCRLLLKGRKNRLLLSSLVINSHNPPSGVLMSLHILFGCRLAKFPPHGA